MQTPGSCGLEKTVDQINQHEGGREREKNWERERESEEEKKEK